MTYHDGEVLTYAYDSGGLPRAATGKKLGITYPYVEKLEYDKFEQRAFLKEGNGVETAYTYDPLDRRLDRLQAGAPNDPNGDFQDLSYSYDDVGNILKLDNTAKIPKAGEYGGPVTQTFQYDGLYRLTKADGTWRYDPNKKSVYSFSQSYDTIHNITKKTQTHDVETPGGATVPQKKTSYDLTYSYTSSHPHAPTKISGTDDVHKGGRTFEYDKNGNQLGFDVINSGQKRSIVWDEENRIQEIHDNGRTSRFKYNDAGERVIKRTEQGETAYVNQFWTVRNRSVGTKHIFVGETRIASKLVPGEDHVQPESLWSQTLGGWWKQLSQGQKPFKNPHFTGSNMPQKLPEDNFVYFYHPDHVGSTSYVTDKDGELYEHVQYFPFGETWVHEHSNTEKLPYLYTSKELDEETGLYYFGARYYDPRTSVWQSADPIFDGSLLKPIGLAVFTYGHNNPLRMTDPTGLSALTGTWTAENEPGPNAQLNEESAPLGIHIRGPGPETAPHGLSAPPARGNVGLLSEPEFKIEDTSETWETGFLIATAFVPGTATELLVAKVASKVGWLKGLLFKEGAAAGGAVVRVGSAACFTGDTKILTRDGSRPISEVEVGDDVWSFDSELQEWRWMRVTKTFVHDHEGSIYAVHIGDGEVNVTGNHPFCAVGGLALAERTRPADIGSDPLSCGGRGRWVEAQDLMVGDTLLGAYGPTPVAHISSAGSSLRVYNIQVEGTHTYAIGPAGVLAHNKPMMAPKAWARWYANRVLDHFKATGSGAGARSGMHGVPYNQAARAIREAAKSGRVPSTDGGTIEILPEVAAELRVIAKQFEMTAKGIGHAVR